MAKIVKYCGACDEGFAEKFGFCPTCGGKLEAFEMNPVNHEIKEPEVLVTDKLDEKSIKTRLFENRTPLVTDSAEAAEGSRSSAAYPLTEQVFENNYSEEEILEASAVTEEIPIVSDEEIENAVVSDPEYFADTNKSYTKEPIYYQTEPKYADEVRPKSSRTDDGYHITVIEEKNNKQRNGLLLASFAFMLILALGGTVFSLFNKSLAVGAIGDDYSLVASLLDDVPMPVEEIKEKKNKDDGGGGGGGGRNEETEASQGDMANQTKNPIRPPDAKTYRSDNFELKMPPASTKGNQQFEQKYNRYGDPNSKYAGLSNGTGSGGGLGNGYGTGQGSGSGSGTGSGTGSGYGGGNGTGNGDGDGPGDNAPPPKAAPAKPFRILTKPKPPYTDEARRNNVQGKVILKVTFLPSGQIGTISTIKGLPNGLTEQAIAAARSIKFETGKAVTKSIEYNFTMY